MSQIQLCDECGAGNVPLTRRPVTLINGLARYDVFISTTDYDHWLCEFCDYAKEALADEDALCQTYSKP